MNLFSKIIFGSLILILTTTTCDLKQCYKSLNIEIPVALAPALDTFQVGDTIWIKSIIGNIINDLQGEDEYDFSDFNFVFYLDINRQDTSASYFHVERDEFEYVSVKGSIEVISSGAVSTIELIYDKENDKNKVEGGIIPKRRGLYELIFYAYLDHYRSFKLAGNDCYHSAEDISFLLNDGGENYYEILIPHTPPQRLNTPEGFRHDGGYAFWVVE